MQNPNLTDFRDILVYQDATKAPGFALRRALEAARNTAARVTVVDVVSETPAFIRTWWPASADEINATMAVREVRLEEMLASLQKDRIPVKISVLQGRPYAALIREMLNGRHDVLMKDADSNSLSRFSESMDQRLLKYCPGPVWLFRNQDSPKCAKVVAAIDPAGTDANSDALNKKIVRLASLICKQDQGRLSVASVWHASRDLLRAEETAQVEFGQFQERFDSAARATVERALNASVTPTAADYIYCLAGAPSEEIGELVEELAADLLVIGITHRGGAGGLFTRSTAEKLLRRVTASLLVVKPDDLSSPFRYEPVEPHATENGRTVLP